MNEDQVLDLLIGDVQENGDNYRPGLVPKDSGKRIDSYDFTIILTNDGVTVNGALFEHPKCLNELHNAVDAVLNRAALAQKQTVISTLEKAFA